MEGVEEEGGLLGALLARAREARHLTRDALGALFGVEAFVIAHWESSGASPEVQPILERWIAHQANPSGEERDACRVAAKVVESQALPLSACRASIQRRIERSVASKEDAEDVVQATFVKLVNSGYRRSVPLKLAHDVARKVLFSFWRKRALRASREVHVENIDVLDAPQLDASDTGKQILLKELAQLLAELLDVLNKNQRGVAERWLDGLSHAEISQELGITSGQSREYLRQAQNKWKRWRNDQRCADLRAVLGGIFLYELMYSGPSVSRRVAQVAWKHAGYVLVGCSLLGFAGIGGWAHVLEQSRSSPVLPPDSIKSPPTSLSTPLPHSSGLPVAYPVELHRQVMGPGQAPTVKVLTKPNVAPEAPRPSSFPPAGYPRVPPDRGIY